jgi:TetR/AcrR family transcriptional repressor of mexJK operon
VQDAVADLDQPEAAVQKLCQATGLPDDLDAERRPLRPLLRAIGLGFLTLLTSPESVRLYRLVVGNAGAHPEVGRIFYETGPRTFIPRLSALLERRDAEGEIAIAEPTLAAAQFFAMLRGELHLRLALGVQAKVGRKELERYVEACVDLFLRGYAARPSPRRS